MVGRGQTHADPLAQQPIASLGMLSQLHGSVAETGQELGGLGMKTQA